MSGRERGARLRETSARLARQAQRFEAEHGETLAAYRQAISDALGEGLERLRRDVDELSGGNPLCTSLLAQATDYVDWLQWTFWDLPYFALSARPEPERLGRSVASCGLIYLSIRVLDDILDRHFWYRGRRTTLLAERAASEPPGERAEGLTMLASMLLCFEGLERLIGTSEEDPVHGPAARQALAHTVGATRRVLVGMIMEESDAEQWSPAFYRRLIVRKNVDYWRSLYAAVDPDSSSPLVPFLERYYALAQKLNDLQDVGADAARGQPNLISVLRRARNGNGDGGGDGGPAVMPAVEDELGDDFDALLALAAALPPLERAIAELKLGESLAEAVRLGLWAAAEDAGARAPRPSADELLGLSWDIDLETVLERLGPDAVVAVPCPVCGGDGRRAMLRHQGFEIHRCLDCFHAYVSPRLAASVQARIADEVDRSHGEDGFLEVQKIYAETLCRRLRKALAERPGEDGEPLPPRPAQSRRLLDIGFGSGYLMQVARAYGFEVYGIDGSAKLVAAQEPYFGGRLARVVLGEDPVPWGAFDVVVMSHVVEHLADPGAVLAQVRAAMAPGGVLYVAVPDLGSVQFQVLGRRWNVINPLVHFQYFNQTSLTRLLEDAGFARCERVEHPPFRDEVSPAWMKLMRDLGGSESGELAMLARVSSRAS